MGTQGPTADEVASAVKQFQGELNRNADAIGRAIGGRDMETRVKPKSNERVLERAFAQTQTILETAANLSGDHPIGVAKLIRDVWNVAIEELNY
ncbi:hypothetical protein LCGC14_2311090 [marine sediment metagenome]|uniref:Uncharacterized protein n=1 Tax=marine sediment metagenome TaxID=412755 RepID=A0A0F9CKP0_9ZZZZ